MTMRLAHDRVISARAELVLDQPFFAMLALRLEVVESRQIVVNGMPTMATDGKRLLFHPDFVDSCTDEELKAVMCHEVLHCADGHPWRRDWRKKGAWNCAADYAINPFVVDAGFKLPGHPLLSDEYSGKSAEEIYRLRAEKGEDKQDGDGDKGGGEPGPDGHGGDEGEGEGHSHGPGCGGGCVQDWPGDSDISPQEAETEWRLATKQAAEMAKAMGKLPGKLESLIDELVKPKMDWRALLRQFVETSFAKMDYTYRRPNSRFIAGGMYLPMLHSEQYPPMVIGEDTSGSVSDIEAKINRSEIKAVVEEVQPETVWWMQADAAVQKVTEFQVGDEFKLEKIYGRGGTDFRPVFDKIKEMGIEPACLIYFTDTFGQFPKEPPEYPVLWAVVHRSGQQFKQPPFGELLLIE